MKTKDIKSPFKKVFRELVVIKRLDEPNDKTSGGLIIPEKYRIKPTKAVVVHVGEGFWCKEHPDDLNYRTGKYAPMEVKVGDTVFFNENAHIPIKIKGEEYIALREGDLEFIIDS